MVLAHQRTECTLRGRLFSSVVAALTILLLASTWTLAAENAALERLMVTGFDLDVDPLLAEPGGAVELAVTFAAQDSGAVKNVRMYLEPPTGWSVAGEEVQKNSLSPNETISHSWLLSVPADTAEDYGMAQVVVEFLKSDQPEDEPALRVTKPVRISVKTDNVDYLSDYLFILTEVNGWGPMERDRANGERDQGDGPMLGLRGTTYTKGLGVHANSEVVIVLYGRYKRFTADVGIDDSKAVDGHGSIAFEIIANGKVIASSGLLKGAHPVHTFDVDVTGIDALLLRVTDGGDGNARDHGNWADAKLHKQ